MKYMQRWASTAVVAVTLVGCGGEAGFEDEVPVDTIETGTEASGLFFTYPKWPNGVVPVCWTAASQARTDFAMRSAQVRRIAESSWPMVANVRFTGWGGCPANTGGMLTINLEDNNFGSATGGYYGTNTTHNMRLGVQRGDFLGGLIPHEFGHVLGFQHEFDRADFQGEGGSCEGNNTSGGPNNERYVETPADRESIMASTGYCQTNANLSEWDIVGVQVVYGRKPTGSLVGPENHCVDIPLDPTADHGDNLQLYRCNGGYNQRWRFTSQEQLIAFYGGGYLPWGNIYDRLVMDVEGGQAINGANAQVFHGGTPTPANQKWRFDDTQIVGYGGRCLAADALGYNAAVRMKACDGSYLQKWRMLPHGSGWRLRHATSGYCVDVPGGTGHSGEDLQLYPCHSGSAQRFTIGSGGSFKHANLCFDVEGANNGSSIVGRKVQLYTCKSSSDDSRFNQLWHFRGPIETLGSKCLDIRGGTYANGTDVRVWSCHGATNQQFDYYPYWY